MMYELFKTGVDDEESLEESSPDASGPTEESLKESDSPVTTPDLIEQAKRAHKKDEVL